MIYVNKLHPSKLPGFLTTYDFVVDDALKPLLDGNIIKTITYYLITGTYDAESDSIINVTGYLTSASNALVNIRIEPLSNGGILIMGLSLDEYTYKSIATPLQYLTNAPVFGD